MAKRRILLVDDEVTVLLTMKAVLEISGFDVETAASAREAKHKIKVREYQMIITDMRMESDASGHEVIQAARNAPYHPAVALLTAFPVDADEFGEIGADKMLVKPMHTRALIQSIENLMEKHSAKLARLSSAAAGGSAALAASSAGSGIAKSDKSTAVKHAAKKHAAKHAEKHAAKKHAAKKHAAKKHAAKKHAAKKHAARHAIKHAAKKGAAKKSASVTDTAPANRALGPGKKTAALPPPSR